MKLLEDRMQKDGKALPPDIIKVDSFLNHQLDVALIDELGKEIYNRFSDCKVTKILTVEASGIAIACSAARLFGVPVVFAKKGERKNIAGDNYTADSYSFTHGTSYTMFASKKYITADDTVLVVDDFLADGNATLALKKIIDDAGAQLAGCAIAVEKGFQSGGKKLRDMGIRVLSLAIVDSMEGGVFTFREQND